MFEVYIKTLNWNKLKHYYKQSVWRNKYPSVSSLSGSSEQHSNSAWRNQQITQTNGPRSVYNATGNELHNKHI